jgi:alpha-beta hydrolase superfamily lysophospholipase
MGALLGLIIAFVIYLNSRTDLQAWHTVELDTEFTAESKVADFEAYLALEDRLFRQVDEDIYDVLPAARGQSIDRYRRGSLADPHRWSPDWNRSFVLPTESPEAAVLLLHGMSDSPYSLRQLGEHLHAAGAYVIGLRLPGHGTAPAGLVELTWQDMDAALRLAVQHLAEQAAGRPLYLVGYSTGAALAVNYALATLDEPTLPRVERIALVSPAIGVTPAAALAVWQARLGHLLGLDKLAWSDILPEYDPFKYNSFAVNAGDVVYRLTREIQRRMAARTKQEGGLTALPPILAFSSVVDATVSTPALVAGLFRHLPAGDHELVLFDINRRTEIEPILGWNPAAIVEVLREETARSYRLSLVTNENPDSNQVVLHTIGITNDQITTTPLQMSWPTGLYSLAHVALPFPPEDPLYGGAPNIPSPGIRLGTLALRGERGVLQTGAADMLRLRWNPFYPFVQQRTLQFFGLDG